MGEARFNYYKDDNERKESHLQKLYNSSFTERQRQIINGECPNGFTLQKATGKNGKVETYCVQELRGKKEK